MRFLDDYRWSADGGIEGARADRRAFDFQTGKMMMDGTILRAIVFTDQYTLPYWIGAAMSERIQLALVKVDRLQTTRFPVKKRIYNTIANRAIHRMATRRTPDADSLRSLASVAPRAAIGDRGRSAKQK